MNLYMRFNNFVSWLGLKKFFFFNLPIQDKIYFLKYFQLKKSFNYYKFSNYTKKKFRSLINQTRIMDYKNNELITYINSLLIPVSLVYLTDYCKTFNKKILYKNLKLFYFSKYNWKFLQSSYLKSKLVAIYYYNKRGIIRFNSKKKNLVNKAVKQKNKSYRIKNLKKKKKSNYVQYRY